MKEQTLVFALLFPSNKTAKETTLKVIFIASVFSEIQGVFREHKRSDLWISRSKEGKGAPVSFHGSLLGEKAFRFLHEY